MNEVEEFYLQHAGVKGMKWGVRKKRETKGQNKSSKKAGPYSYTDADGNTWTTSFPLSRAKEKALGAKPNKAKPKPKTDKRIQNRNIQKAKTPNEKKEPAKEYTEAYEKGRKRGKQAKRVSQAIDTASALAYSGFVTAAFFRMANPQAYTKASNIVDSAIKGAGLYAKYAAQSATPSRYTVKARDIINAAVVNSGNEVGFVR